MDVGIIYASLQPIDLLTRLSEARGMSNVNGFLFAIDAIDAISAADCTAVDRFHQ